MPVGHKIPGVTPLLFDRLGRTPPSAGEDESRYARQDPRHIYDETALKRSIGEQLAWLLNTRTPVAYDILDARNRDGVRSTLDYGLPDLSAYPVREHAAMTRLRVHLAQTIAFFEPRLHDPAVEIRGVEGGGDRLLVEVQGKLRIGEVMTPAAFQVALDSEGGSHG